MKGNTMNIMKRYGAKAAVLATLPLALVTQAYAEVPAAVKTDLATAKADSLEVGGIIIGIFVAIFALMLMKRFFR